MIRKGFVYLVGAGPGDPGLLTLRAAELLKTAEVIAYDELVAPAILAMGNPHAEYLSVGRRHGQGTISYRLHPEAMARARAGKVVVRLKAGDPLIFGRGGEEAEELFEANIPFEIVPGVSAALGAAAYAGIPLTHRDLSSEVTFLSGHATSERVTASAPGVVPVPVFGTLAMYMAGKTLTHTLERLVQNGRFPQTPAAYILNATTVQQRVVVGTLSTLATQVAALEFSGPGLVLVGEVVRLREKIKWFEERPLKGRCIWLARARPARSGLAAALRQSGAQVVEIPDLQAAPLTDFAELDQVLSLSMASALAGSKSSWVFGCAAGVDAVFRRLKFLFSDGLQGYPGYPPMYAIGTEVETALAEYGITPRLILGGTCDDELRRHAAQLIETSLVLFTSQEGRPGLAQGLQQLSAQVRSVSAYQCLSSKEKNTLSRVPDLILVPSSTACSKMANHLEGQINTVNRIRVVAMGKKSAASASACGFLDVVCLETDTSQAMLEQTLRLLHV